MMTLDPGKMCVILISLHGACPFITSVGVEGGAEISLQYLRVAWARSTFGSQNR